MNKVLAVIIGLVLGALVGLGVRVAITSLKENAELSPHVLICVNELSGEVVALKSETTIQYSEGKWTLSSGNEILWLEKASSDRCSAVSLEMAKRIMSDLKKDTQTTAPKQIP